MPSSSSAPPVRAVAGRGGLRGGLPARESGAAAAAAPGGGAVGGDAIEVRSKVIFAFLSPIREPPIMKGVKWGKNTTAAPAVA